MSDSLERRIVNIGRVNELNRSPNSVDVIVPSFNEHENVALCVDRIFGSFSDSPFVCNVIVVLDGPDIAALMALNNMKNDKIKIIQFETNQGKGSALRAGIHKSQSSYVAFIDADLDIHPDAICTGLDLLQNDETIVGVYGSKVHPESVVSYPATRRVMSLGFRLFLRAILRLNVSDTQTGLKVFRSAELKKILPESNENGYMFDLEILLLLSRSKYQFASVPITLDYQFNSSVKVSTAWQMARQSLAVRRNLH